MDDSWVAIVLSQVCTQNYLILVRCLVEDLLIDEIIWSICDQYS